MEDELLTLLATNKIFSSLPGRVRKKLIPQFEKIELAEDEILYYQGDPSDSIELVQQGALSSILTTANGENKIVGEIIPGETVGELGALSAAPRSTTIKAIKESVLFRLPSDVFTELCHRYSAFLFAIINPMVTRSQRLIELVSSERFKRHITIIAANEEVPLAHFAASLNQEAKGLHSVVFLSDFNEDSEPLTQKKIHSILEEAKAKNVKKIKQKTIYLLKPKDTELAQHCFDKTEMLYILGYEKAPIMLNNFVTEKLQAFKANNKIKAELILLHDKNTKLPHNTATWLQLTEFGLHHNIRTHNEADFSRLLRFLRNKPVGVVLGGGGTRGWAHAGAIKALTDAGIPIDMIGGASVGAIVAASYALTQSETATLAQFAEVIEASRYSVAWRSLTWPAISLFNSKGLTTVLQKLFDNIRTEDLWLPFFCISTNLAKNTETIHRFGSLWEQVRCSVAIPGVIPPMLQNGELHFDGGLLNNLPVDVMRKIIGFRATIVAVELTASNNDDNKYEFPPILTFWRTLLGKFGIIPKYKFPRFIDTFLKSLLAGSSVKAKQNSLIADILVSLDLSQFPMLHSNKKLEARIIEMGHDSTVNSLKNMKRKK